MAHYRDDPRWITARYPGTDANGQPFKAGDEVFYYPRSKKFYTGEAAQQASRDFASACFDEGGY